MTDLETERIKFSCRNHLLLSACLNNYSEGIEARAFQSIGLGAGRCRRSRPSRSIRRSALELLVVAGLIAFFLLVRLTLSVEKPNPAQQIAEMIHELGGDLGEQIIGHGYERSRPSCTCIFLFVLLNNLLGLIPGIAAPTSSPWVPLGLAVPTFLYYNYQGFREQGVIGYMKHFAGPSGGWRGCCCRSRSSRTWRASCRSPFVFMPTCLPAIWSRWGSSRWSRSVFRSIFLGLHVLVSLIQAYVFMLLTMIYLSLAVRTSTRAWCRDF